MQKEDAFFAVLDTFNDQHWYGPGTAYHERIKALGVGDPPAEDAVARRNDNDPGLAISAFRQRPVRHEQEDRRPLQVESL